MDLAYGKWYVGVEWNGGNSWIYPFNWLPREERYWGRKDMFHDGPLPTFGLWFFNTSWLW